MNIERFKFKIYHKEEKHKVKEVITYLSENKGD